MSAAVFNPETLPLSELDRLFKIYDNAYGHLQPATVQKIIPEEKYQRITAVNAAYRRRSPQPIQQHFKF